MASAAAPGDPRFDEANIAASTLAGLVDYGREQGRDPARWFAGSALTPENCVDPDARLSFREVTHIVRAALRDFPKGWPLGLAVGSRITMPAMGALGFSLMSSPDLAAAADLGARYHPVSGSLMDVSCRMAQGEFLLEAHERFELPDLRRFLCEKFFASALAATRALAGEAYAPLRLELAYPAPPGADAYRRLFRCPVQFSATRHCLATDPAVLRRRIATGSASGQAEALRLCEARMPRRTVLPDELASLQAWLRQRLGAAPRATEAAQALGCSERTLRRRLSQAGISFRLLHDRLRAERAQKRLGDARVSVGEVAGELGFSDEREFRRAYKRWTGHTPSAARRR